MAAWFSMYRYEYRVLVSTSHPWTTGDGRWRKKQNGDGNCWLVTLESARIAAIAGNTGGLHHEEVGTASSWLGLSFLFFLF